MTDSNLSSPSGRQLRRQILRQAVETNLSERAGTRAVPRVEPAALAPGRRFWSGKRPVWLLLPVFLIAASLPFLRSSKAPANGVAAETAESRAAESRTAESRTAESRTEVAAASKQQAQQPVVVTPLFNAPQPIDLDVFPLAVRRVVIDPGHGGEDTGTTGGGLAEKDLTLDIALRVREQLVEQGFEVFMTRDDDRAISLRQRALQANSLRSDLFLSIHINWIVERSVRGLETYFLGTTDDPELNALARIENRDSGYSLADMRHLLDGLYTGVRQDESHRFATNVQHSLYRSLLRQNPKLENRGIKTAPFVVLVATEMPAILAEVSCLSNEQEAQLLARPLYRQHIAEALSRGIRSYADEVNQSEAKGS